MDDSTSQPVHVWVLSDHADSGCFERLGDAARLARALGSRVGVGLLRATADEAASFASESLAAPERLRQLIRCGADLVRVTRYADFTPLSGLRLAPQTMAQVAVQLLSDQQARVVFVGADAITREWSALLAAELELEWISPVLLARYRSDRIHITRLDREGRQACQMVLAPHQAAMISMRDGVAEALPEDTARPGVVEDMRFSGPSEALTITPLAVDPVQADIRECKKLISGGRGLGSAAGFELLRRFAACLDAGVAASRMAVDLGWIEYERQVGQTGKTVQPDLYIACGISGASHHLDGMSSAKHIVAINSDAAAPIMKVAHLKLAADLHEVLRLAADRLNGRVQRNREDA